MSPDNNISSIARAEKVSASLMAGALGDSTGAIAGNLLGLMYPEQISSHPLLNELGGKHLIEKMATGLAKISLNY